MTTSTRTVTSLLNHRITVFENDHVGDKITTQGLYEKENLEFLNHILHNMQHGVVLDIGANIGNHALAFSTRAKQVYAFEPLPAVYSLLSENVSQNKISNIKTFNLALSDHNGEDTLYMVREGNVGASSFDKREDNVDPVTVEKKVGDVVIRELELKRLDMIKLDVEAHEVFVLRGLMDTLQKFKPYIAMEWNDPLTIERLSQSDELQFLFQHYNVYVLGSNYDRAYWQGQSMAFLRRKWTRMTKPRSARLYPFNPARLYKNLLLVPIGRERYLPKGALPES